MALVIFYRELCSEESLQFVDVLGGVLKLTATAVKTNIFITAAADFSFPFLWEKVVPFGGFGSFADGIWGNALILIQFSQN